MAVNVALLVVRVALLLTRAARISFSVVATLANLQKQLANLGKTPTPPRENNRQRRACPNFKKDVYHASDDCYELKKMPT